MEAEVIAAIIAVCGAIFSTGISLVIGFWSKRHNANQLFAETVSSNRMDWINVWRENISIFLATAEVLNNLCNKCEKDKDKHCSCDKVLELQKEMFKAREMITTRLNMNEELHRLMFATIKQIDYSKTNDRFIAQREYIEELARQILKPEWERMKREAKGKEN